ncbi:hypothetical protein VTO42DRAFT_6717 [Malbranchea cinnamomea]
MLPSVAYQSPQFLPHQHLDHRSSFNSMDQSYDLTNSAINAALRQHLPAQQPASSFQPLSRTRNQYPQPIQRPTAQSLAPPGPGTDSEHSLRRKTPSGTIPGGYDADRSIQPPASKHIIVSSLDNGQVLSSQTGLPSDLTQYNSNPSISLSQYPNFPVEFSGGNDRSRFLNTPSQGLHGGSWIRSLNYPASINPVLNQSSAQPLAQRNYWQPGPTTPSVIASPFQPGPGQASSGGFGQYGPYWPDGGYMPYYPAALRDSRYQSTPQVRLTGQEGPLTTFQTPFNRPSIPSSDHITPKFAWNPLPARSGQHAAQGYNPDLSQTPFPTHHVHVQSGQEQLWGQHPQSYQTTHLSQLGVDNYLTQNATTSPGGFQSSAVEMIPQQPRNAEFKEKILSWAHSVYVDLLASLHNARRRGLSHGGHELQARNVPNPSIYPKPPRQPASDFSTLSANNDAQSTLRFHPHSRTHFRESDPSSAFLDQKLGSSLHISPSSNNFVHGNVGARGHLTSSFDQRSSIERDGYRNVRRSFAGSPSRLFNPSYHGMSPTENAAAALEILSSLCIESGWEWIEGMLVGGCLAYGLGDYNKAFRWYSRIIHRDPNHVEAISNLAATLLALDRREEALQYWLRAVKLRPGYFEAVEHLIGLLCTSQRGKDAISIIQFVEDSLRHAPNGESFTINEDDDCSGDESEDMESTVSMSDRVAFDYGEELQSPPAFKNRLQDPGDGFGSSGYNIPGIDNGRMLALIHAKGNMLYALGDQIGAAASFEEAILIATGRRRRGLQSLIRRILAAFQDESHHGIRHRSRQVDPQEILLLFPDRALQTAKLVFPPYGNPPGLRHIPDGMSKKAAISTTSNSLLSLAKIYQDGMSSSSPTAPKSPGGVRDILALYYLSLALQPSPSTANNVGILLASIQGTARAPRTAGESQLPDIPGVVPGSGIALALAYYNYGLNLDSRHAHLYTNLGSLLKDIGQLPAAIKMYEQAVQCDNNFDIALANLANAVKDSGRINDAIGYYRRAVNANPDFAEAVCGLANALNSVCNWVGRGGIAPSRGIRDRWHVDDQGMLRDANEMGVDSGWMKRVVDIVDKQLKDGELWGTGSLAGAGLSQILLSLAGNDRPGLLVSKRGVLNSILQAWSGQKWEGSRIVRLVERVIRWLTWQWYQDLYVHGKEYPASRYARPQLPVGLSTPNAPTVLPFHTFTCPLSAKQIRHISQRNGLRISCSTLRSPWLPATVYRPPAPPNPHLNVGYVSSDFNNHPLAHLMQSVFGLHNPRRVKAFCYATTPSDNSVHRQQIEREAPVFRDVSGWSVDRLVEQIVNDGIHILVNLNGYTRGARNEVFAARPAPIHMSFMGFAGTLGAEWCDYILADELSIPREVLGPRMPRNMRMEDRLFEKEHGEELDEWVFAERIVYTRHTFFCCDHRQSAPDAQTKRLTWEEEQVNRWRMRKELFPDLPDDTVILGNFNQLYKIEPTTFRTWLRILARTPNAVLWLLRFPDVGEPNLRNTAVAWAGEATASRIIFTDVAPKGAHINRARICDLFLDTPECNAHTTAADVLWSGTPLLTYPRYKYKMCSRMASSILTSALPQNELGRQAAAELIASSDAEYEKNAIRLSQSLKYEIGGNGRASGRLFELRKMLFLNRWDSKLFDTRRWVRDLEDAYDAVWSKWVKGEEGDIWL